MKIGIYDPYLDDLGGGEKYVLKLAECLSQRHKVIIFWDYEKDLKEAIRRFSLDLANISLAPNIFSPKISLIKRLWETRKYDVIIFLSDGSIPLVLSKKLFLHLQQPIPGLKTNLKTKFKISRVSRVFCNSYYSKSYVDKDLGVDSLVLYPPIEINVQRVKKTNTILHVGRFRPKDPMTGANDYKKQKTMVEVFKDMAQKGLCKDWRFILAVSVRAGEENFFAGLKKRGQGFPIEYLVNKTGEELWGIYSCAKIYWHATGFGEDLERHPEYAEHFGISTVEAMGAGCVPVVINAGGQKEIVEDGVNGFLWDSREELQRATLKLIGNITLWRQMSEKAKKRARFFAQDRFCNEASKLIEET